VPRACHKPDGSQRRRFREGRGRRRVCLIGGHRGGRTGVASTSRWAELTAELGVPRAEYCAIAVMAKAPRIGAAKTRLVPPLSGEEAAGLSACFIRDAAENIAAATTGGDRGLHRLFTDGCGGRIYTAARGRDAIIA